jgi:hypothetical protein
MLKKFALAGLVAMAAASGAQANPDLQLYIEGGTYCGAGVPASACYPGQGTIIGYNDESWSLAGTTGLRLWAVAETESRTWRDVRLVVSYELAAGTPGFNLAGTTIGSGYAPITDSAINLPIAPTFEGDNTTILSSLQRNAYLGPSNMQGVVNGRGFQVFNLGDMGIKESNGFDVEVDLSGTGVIGSLESGERVQINAYDVTFDPAALEGYVVRFDLWACTADVTYPSACTNGDRKFAPFSHDAQWLQIAAITETPEPAGLALLLGGMLGLSALRRRKG